VPKRNKTGGVGVIEDARGTEAARASSSEDKLCAMKQHCRARGLCDRCTGKWSYDHKCATTVQLHAIQELWDLFPEEEGDDAATLAWSPPDP
jgi:hypothetical protein